MDTNVRDLMLQLRKEGGVFRLFSEEEIDHLSSYFKILKFPEGEIVAKSGQPMDLMGVMVAGEVILEEETELKGNWFVHGRMSRGAILAHPSFFDVKPPPVRVLVQKEATFLGTDEATFDEFLSKHPAMGIIFLKELVRILFMRTRVLAARLNVVI